MFPIVAIIGPRQCGKSTFVKNLKPDWRYIDLEKEEDFSLVSNDTRSFFERYPKELIIDEAQELPALLFVIEEIINGFNALVTGNIDYYFYRTRDKSEIDLIIDAPFGVIPIEIKLGKVVNRRMLTGPNNFIDDMKAPFGILINSGFRVELLSDKIIQIPATCL